MSEWLVWWSESQTMHFERERKKSCSTSMWSILKRLWCSYLDHPEIESNVIVLLFSLSFIFLSFTSLCHLQYTLLLSANVMNVDFGQNWKQVSARWSFGENLLVWLFQWHVNEQCIVWPLYSIGFISRVLSIVVLFKFLCSFHSFSMFRIVKETA